MHKNKVKIIIDSYALDKGTYIYIVLSFALLICLFLCLYYSVFLLIPICATISFLSFLIIKLIITKRRLIKGDLETIEPKQYEAKIKETKETDNVGKFLIKLYIIDEDGHKYNYYYTNGSEDIFKGYKDIINNSKNIKLLVVKKTNIIDSIIVDEEKLKDLYTDIKHSKILKQPIVYEHICYKRSKKGIYKYEEYLLEDIRAVFEHASLYEELFIININNRYAKISFNNETHNEFLFDKTIYSTFDGLKNELEEKNFLFDDKIRVIYTLGDNEPSSFNMVIDEVK